MGKAAGRFVPNDSLAVKSRLPATTVRHSAQDRTPVREMMRLCVLYTRDPPGKSSAAEVVDQLRRRQHEIHSRSTVPKEVEIVVAARVGCSGAAGCVLLCFQPGSSCPKRP